MEAAPNYEQSIEFIIGLAQHCAHSDEWGPIAHESFRKEYKLYCVEHDLGQTLGPVTLQLVNDMCDEVRRAKHHNRPPELNFRYVQAAAQCLSLNLEALPQAPVVTKDEAMYAYYVRHADQTFSQKQLSAVVEEFNKYHTGAIVVGDILSTVQRFMTLNHAATLLSFAEFQTSLPTYFKPKVRLGKKRRNIQQADRALLASVGPESTHDQRFQNSPGDENHKPNWADDYFELGSFATPLRLPLPSLSGAEVANETSDAVLLLETHNSSPSSPQPARLETDAGAGETIVSPSSPGRAVSSSSNPPVVVIVEKMVNASQPGLGEDDDLMFGMPPPLFIEPFPCCLLSAEYAPAPEFAPLPDSGEIQQPIPSSSKKRKKLFDATSIAPSKRSAPTASDVVQTNEALAQVSGSDCDPDATIALTSGLMPTAVIQTPDDVTELESSAIAGGDAVVLITRASLRDRQKLCEKRQSPMQPSEKQPPSKQSPKRRQSPKKPTERRKAQRKAEQDKLKEQARVAEQKVRDFRYVVHLQTNKPKSQSGMLDRVGDANPPQYPPPATVVDQEFIRAVRELIKNDKLEQQLEVQGQTSWTNRNGVSYEMKDIHHQHIQVQFRNGVETSIERTNWKGYAALPKYSIRYNENWPEAAYRTEKYASVDGGLVYTLPGRSASGKFVDDYVYPAQSPDSSIWDAELNYEAPQIFSYEKKDSMIHKTALRNWTSPQHHIIRRENKDIRIKLRHIVANIQNASLDREHHFRNVFKKKRGVGPFPDATFISQKGIDVLMYGESVPYFEASLDFLDYSMDPFTEEQRKKLFPDPAFDKGGILYVPPYVLDQFGGPLEEIFINYMMNCGGISQVWTYFKPGAGTGTLSHDEHGSFGSLNLNLGINPAMVPLWSPAMADLTSDVWWTSWYPACIGLFWWLCAMKGWDAVKKGKLLECHSYFMKYVDMQSDYVDEVFNCRSGKGKARPYAVTKQGPGQLIKLLPGIPHSVMNFGGPTIAKARNYCPETWSRVAPIAMTQRMHCLYGRGHISNRCCLKRLAHDFKHSKVPIEMDDSWTNHEKIDFLTVWLFLRVTEQDENYVAHLDSEIEKLRISKGYEKWIDIPDGFLGCKAIKRRKAVPPLTEEESADRMHFPQDGWKIFPDYDQPYVFADRCNGCAV